MSLGFHPKWLIYTRNSQRSVISCLLTKTSALSVVFGPPKRIIRLDSPTHSWILHTAIITTRAGKKMLSDPSHPGYHLFQLLASELCTQKTADIHFNGLHLHLLTTWKGSQNRDSRRPYRSFGVFLSWWLVLDRSVFWNSDSLRRAHGLQLSSIIPVTHSYFSSILLTYICTYSYCGHSVVIKLSRGMGTKPCLPIATKQCAIEAPSKRVMFPYRCYQLLKKKHYFCIRQRFILSDKKAPPLTS